MNRPFAAVGLALALGLATGGAAAPAVGAPDATVWYLPTSATCRNIDFIRKLHH
jgi:hypothetical protein